jgi:hypothetical protein
MACAIPRVKRECIPGKDRTLERRLMMPRLANGFLTLLMATACTATDAMAPATRALDSRLGPSANESASDASVVEIPYEKWFTTYPAMTGNTSYGPGTFSGTVLSRVPSDNGVIVRLEAIYVVTDPSDASRSFTARIEGKTNLQIQSAVLNGVVTEGWRAGARVHVHFDVVTPCAMATGPSVKNTCYRGTIRVQPNDQD